MQRFDGLTAEQYDQLREHVRWDRDVPAGMTYHVASFDNGILRMTDVWDTEGQFNAFVQARIVPGLQQLGIQSLPHSIVNPVHDVFNLAANTNA
jgi:hypothetical protein